jgi:hypothetical protein
MGPTYFSVVNHGNPHSVTPEPPFILVLKPAIPVFTIGLFAAVSLIFGLTVVGSGYDAAPPAFGLPKLALLSFGGRFGPLMAGGDFWRFGTARFSAPRGRPARANGRPPRARVEVRAPVGVLEGHVGVGDLWGLRSGFVGDGCAARRNVRRVGMRLWVVRGAVGGLAQWRRRVGKAWNWIVGDGRDNRDRRRGLLGFADNWGNVGGFVFWNVDGVLVGE